MTFYKSILLISLLVFLTSSKLLYMSNVFRHGARYPINDLYDGKQMALTRGNLTSVGLREHYLLGNYLKN